MIKTKIWSSSCSGLINSIIMVSLRSSSREREIWLLITLISFKTKEKIEGQVEKRGLDSWLFVIYLELQQIIWFSWEEKRSFFVVYRFASVFLLSRICQYLNETSLSHLIPFDNDHRTTIIFFFSSVKLSMAAALVNFISTVRRR